MFEVAAGSYDRFMGRWSRELAPPFARFAGVAAGMRVLDVGCGPGALTEVVAGIVGAGSVAAAERSAAFAAACAARVPGVDVRTVSAQSLPWNGGAFDAALSQLVVNFLADPPRGVAEMRRVVRGGGVVAACTWDATGGMAMLRHFWDAATARDPSATVEWSRLGRPDELRDLLVDAGLADVAVEPLDVEVAFDGFDQLWLPFTEGVGPAGTYCASLAPPAQAALARGVPAPGRRTRRPLRADGPGLGRPGTGAGDARALSDQRATSPRTRRRTPRCGRPPRPASRPAPPGA